LGKCATRCSSIVEGGFFKPGKCSRDHGVGDPSVATDSGCPVERDEIIVSFYIERYLSRQIRYMG
jgi:hypothetical protein